MLIEKNNLQFCSYCKLPSQWRPSVSVHLPKLKPWNNYTDFITAQIPTFLPNTFSSALKIFLLMPSPLHLFADAIIPPLIARLFFKNVWIMLSVYIFSSSMSVIFFKTELNQLFLSKLTSTDLLQYKFQISQHGTKVTIQFFPSIVFLCPNPVYLDHVCAWKLCIKCPDYLGKVYSFLSLCPKYISSLYISLNLLMTCLHSLRKADCFSAFFSLLKVSPHFIIITWSSI